MRENLGKDVVLARAQESRARYRAECAERDAAIATRDWKRAQLIRERAELWHQADTLRERLADVEAKAAAIKMPDE